MRSKLYAGCWMGAIMFCVAATASSQTVPPASFQAARTYAAGSTPYSVAVGDFNGDGKADLAVADYGNNTASVLLGNGDGTFQPPVNYPVGLSPYSVAVGDFNGDSKPDLALANDGNNTVSVLLGNGDGTFQAAVSFPAGTGPISVAVGDFNNDGKSDLAVANNGNNTVSVLLGNGNGTFQPEVSYTAGASPRSVVVGDFNGDGYSDLAVADSNGGGVSVILNNGNGTFSTTPAFYAAGSYPYSVAVGDFDGDGKPDLAVANSSDSTVSVLLGNGGGTFQAAVNYAVGGQPISVAVGDFNGDGRPDLAVANSSDSTVSVLLGNGDGTFQTTPVNYSVGSDPTSVAVGDFNGDGEPDLALTDSGGSNVSVLLGNGDGTFPAAANYVAGGDPISVAVGDFNNDGKPDLAVTDFTGGVNVLLGNGDGTFQAAVSYPAGSGPSSVAVGDLNHDGNSDLAVADNNDDTVSVLLGNGDGTFQAAVNYPADSTNFLGATSVAVGDFDGDGKPDLAVVNRLLVDVLLGNGDGTFQAPLRYFPYSNPSSLAVGDFNGDGKPDLAVANNGGLSVLLNKGGGTFATAVQYATGTYPKSVAVGDLNGDGKLDLAVANQGSPADVNDVDNVSVLLGNGDGTFQAAVNYAAGSGPSSVIVGDLNGDGKPDLAVANQYPSKNLDGANMSVLLGNGDGTFQAAVNYAAGRGPVSVALGDFNGDGKSDLAVANNSGGKVSVLLSTTRLASSTALTSSLNPSTFGRSVTFTATVSSSGGKPTGIVTFNDGVTALGTGPLSTSGQATFTTVALTTGPHSITAVYGGDSKFLSSTSAPLAETVNQAATATTVTSSLNPSTFGQAVTFMATVSSSGGVPTGTVTFFDGAATLGTGALSTSGQATLATAALSGGTHPITAVYGGDTNFATSASSALTQTVKVSTTTAVTSMPNPSTFGQSVISTATVSSIGGVPTGMVTFFDGATTPPLGTGPLNVSGQATFSTSALAVGSHSITANYSGDTLHNPSTSSVLALTVNKASTTTSVTSSQNPQLVGQPITFTARVDSQFGGIPTCPVIFKSGATTLGTVALSGNQASLTTSFATAGTRSITAQCTGDTNNTGSTSTALSQSVVKKFTTTTLLASSLNPSFIGQAVTFTATISSAGGIPPDGELITFKQGGTVLAMSPLSGGKASFTTSTPLTVGKHTITASYAADATFNASTASLAQTVQKYPTSTSLTSSLNPSIYGQPVTLSATVSSAGPSPTGTVTFKNGTTNLASPVTLSSSGSATLTLTNLAAGILSITATYNGDGSSAVSASNPALAQMVNMATTLTTVVSSLNPSTFGQKVTFTATVSSATVTPTGKVTFSSGATVLGTVSLAGGKASLATTTLPRGTNTITATYNGTSNITGSSGTVVQMVN
jgi:hypothetical protein